MYLVTRYCAVTARFQSNLHDGSCNSIGWGNPLIFGVLPYLLEFVTGLLEAVVADDETAAAQGNEAAARSYLLPKLSPTWGGRIVFTATWFYAWSDRTKPLWLFINLTRSHA